MTKKDIIILLAVIVIAAILLFIHGGSFNSGSKSDGETYCEYYASSGISKVQSRHV